jgi:hypothetical protein
MCSTWGISQSVKLYICGQPPEFTVHLLWLYPSLNWVHTAAYYFKILQMRQRWMPLMLNGWVKMQPPTDYCYVNFFYDYSWYIKNLLLNCRALHWTAVFVHILMLSVFDLRQQHHEQLGLPCLFIIWMIHWHCWLGLNQNTTHSMQLQYMMLSNHSWRTWVTADDEEHLPAPRFHKKGVADSCP